MAGNAQNQELAKRGLPFLRHSDQQFLADQSDDFYKVIEPLSQKKGEHAVNVYSAGKMVGRGTVTSSGIVTKWSELVSKGRQIHVVGHDGVKRKSYVKAVYLDYDLALLDSDGELPAVDFKNSNIPEVGRFLLTVGPAKDSHGFGIVSVAPRSLRESDKAFLGVRMDFRPVSGGGVRLLSATKGGAAEQAGLQKGDIVLKVNELAVDGLYEMGTVLQKLTPGEKVVLHFRRGDQIFAVDTVLGNRPEMKSEEPQRMKEMKRMGGSVNKVAEGFPRVLQSDMQLDSEDAGGPVFDLDGNFVGLIVARASRIKTYIITAENLAEQLQKKPDMTASRPIAQPVSQLEMKEASKFQSEVQQLKEIIKRAERRISELEAK